MFSSAFFKSHRGSERVNTFFYGNNDMQPGFGMKVHRSLNVSGVSSPHDLVAVLSVLVLS